MGEGVSGEVKAIITVAGAFKGMARLTKGGAGWRTKKTLGRERMAGQGSRTTTRDTPHVSCTGPRAVGNEELQGVAKQAI